MSNINKNDASHRVSKPGVSLASVWMRFKVVSETVPWNIAYVVTCQPWSR